MAPKNKIIGTRDLGTDEAFDQYEKEGKEAAEKPGEAQTEEKREFEAVRQEKKLKKPGSVSRFFNQFGIGKYWERLNDYFEQEERMEKEEAEREASKETAGDIKAAAETEVGAVKTKGQEMPKKILESAARAGAGMEEAAPVVAEAKAEEAAIEKTAEAAKADLNEDIEILEKSSLEDEIRGKYKDALARTVDVRIKSLEHQMKTEQDQDARELLEAERDILAEIKKEKMPVQVEDKKIKADGLPAWDEVEELKKVKTLAPEDLPPVEEFEAVAKEHEEQAVPSPEKVKEVEVLEEEVEEPAEEMAKAKVEAIPLDKKKQKEELEDILIDFGFRRGDKVPVIGESGKVDPGWEIISVNKNKGTAFVTKKGKGGEPMLKTIDLEELKQWKRDEEFFKKGERESRKKMWRGVKSLTKARGEAAAQREKRAEEAFEIAEPEIKKKGKSKKTKRKIAA